MPSAIDMMRKREQEIQKAILHLSDRTKVFTNPELIMIGGYALKAFIPLSRFTRDCDFTLRKKDGWNIEELKVVLKLRKPPFQHQQLWDCEMII